MHNFAKILSLQKGLSDLGYDPGPPDGIRGKRTLKAVKAFQRNHGLMTDGIPGPRTRQALAVLLRDGRREIISEPDGLSAPEVETGNVNPDTLQRLVIKEGYSWSNTPGWINLVGIRGFCRGQVTANRFDEYNDTIFVVVNGFHSGDDSSAFAGEPSLSAFDASVDPGRLRVPNPGGVAHLEPGYYLYRLGMHRGREPALVQAGAVTVLRYFDEDPDRQRPKRETGWFGINIHRGGTGKTVGGWSAGCQVIRGEKWSSFISIVQKASEKGQELFGYSLLESSSLLTEVPVIAV